MASEINMGPWSTITDIRHDEILSVSVNDILNELRSTPRHLPELLVYDAKGLQFFSEITRREDYYPRHSELRMLRQYAPAIIQNARDGDVYIELGAG